MMIVFQFEPFYYFYDQLHFRSMYNDTVFMISSDSIVSDYFIDIGKFKLPPELRPEMVLPDPAKTQTFNQKASEYYYCSAFESTGNIFLTTPNFNDSVIRYLLYNKNTGEGCMLINENAESSGMINDWDGGLDF